MSFGKASCAQMSAVSCMSSALATSEFFHISATISSIPGAFLVLAALTASSYTSCGSCSKRRSSSTSGSTASLRSASPTAGASLGPMISTHRSPTFSSVSNSSSFVTLPSASVRTSRVGCTELNRDVFDSAPTIRDISVMLPASCAARRSTICSSACLCTSAQRAASSSVRSSLFCSLLHAAPHRAFCRISSVVRSEATRFHRLSLAHFGSTSAHVSCTAVFSFLQFPSRSASFLPTRTGRGSSNTFFGFAVA